MTESSGRQPARPEVVQAISDALMYVDPHRLDAIKGLIAPAELVQAQQLFAAELEADQDQRERRLAAWQALTAHRWPDDATWAQVFDLLTLEQAVALRDLYDALPDGAVAEYTRRYGYPEDI